MNALKFTYVISAGLSKNIFVRDCRWKLVDVVLGFDTLEQYIAPEYRKNYPYFGALIGRHGNRIKGGEIAIANETHVLNKNEKGNTLHGGTPGFDQRLLGRRTTGQRTSHSALH